MTGAKGFVGRNLVETLKTVRDGKKKDTGLRISRIYEYDRDSTASDLERFTKDCDFVFNLAGANRPKDVLDYGTENCGFAGRLLGSLRSNGNICPVMLASSIQASLAGRFAGSEYGKSKLAGEGAFFRHASETGGKVLVYRFPNVFGKWCRPHYNSAVATFCHAIANGEPYAVSDRNAELELLYIDDLVDAMLKALAGDVSRCDYDGTEAVPSETGRFCHVPRTYRATLGRIADLLEGFGRQPETLRFASVPKDSFEKKLYSTYLSYLPPEKMIFDLSSSEDERGSFTEFFRNADIGQFSINVSRPGAVKGQHWHHTKTEIFLVVSGHGLVQERRVGTDPATGVPYPVCEFKVGGDRLRCVYMLPGYTHNIINLSDTEDLITVMWANELFDSEHPETYHEEVVLPDENDV